MAQKSLKPPLLVLQKRTEAVLQLFCYIYINKQSIYFLLLNCPSMLACLSIGSSTYNMIHMCILLACGTLLCVFVDCGVLLDSGYILGCTPVYRQANVSFSGV